MEEKEQQMCSELPKKVLIEEILTETNVLKENDSKSNLLSDQNEK